MINMDLKILKSKSVTDEYFYTKQDEFCKKYHISAYTAIKIYWKRSVWITKDDNGAICTKCWEYKTWEYYAKHPWTKTWRQTSCKDCYNKAQKIRKKERKNKIIPVGIIKTSKQSNYWDWIWELVSYWPMRTIVFGKQY